MFDASADLEIPTRAGVALGLAAFQSENAWYFLGVRRRPDSSAERLPSLELFLEKRGTTAVGANAHARSSPHSDIIARTQLRETPTLKLKISGNARAYSFYFDADGSGWKPLREADDGSILSTDVAGGFVGTVVGPYARSEPARE